MRLSPGQRRVLLDLAVGKVLVRESGRYFFRALECVTIYEKTVDRLSDQGLVRIEQTNEGANVKISDQGVHKAQGMKKEPPRYNPCRSAGPGCDLCGKPSTPSGCFHPPQLTLRPCGICSFDHKVCAACWRKYQRFMGTFPAWGIRLSRCARGGDRVEEESPVSGLQACLPGAPEAPVQVEESGDAPATAPLPPAPPSPAVS